MTQEYVHYRWKDAKKLKRKMEKNQIEKDRKVKALVGMVKLLGIEQETNLIYSINVISVLSSRRGKV